ncbi:DUF305 domain-containing protein [Saccharopolyspora taberi]|uniref:DUF305 domain-containing protein n=1 Tax=Saccharopolyspora taberi TaxID=60895 RepID=A0ABN3UZR6_9PSEU
MQVAGRFVAALVAFVALGACAPAEQPPAAPVVLPGAPGDEPKIATAEDLRQLARSAPPGTAEATYVTMMIGHHQQALDMTALAPTRAQHPKVRALAERIGGAQAPEIAMMQGWLAGHGGEHAAHGHDHGTMPGMATPEQLSQLAASNGKDFDRLFLQLMTTHHEGALTMATDLLTQGLDEQVHEMAQDVLATQTDEIATMRGLAAEVG